MPFSCARRVRALAAAALVAGVSLLPGGCVRRSLTIKSDPPGALVYVNDQLIGQTPVSYDFMWYGWQRVSLHKDGFERFDDRRKLRAPVHLWIPFDLAMELMPFTIRDDRTWAYDLTAMPVPTPPAPPEPVAAPIPPSPETPLPLQPATTGDAPVRPDTGQPADATDHGV
jgi:hypothetical protein